MAPRPSISPGYVRSKLETAHRKTGRQAANYSATRFISIGTYPHGVRGTPKIGPVKDVEAFCAELNGRLLAIQNRRDVEFFPESKVGIRDPRTPQRAHTSVTIVVQGGNGEAGLVIPLVPVPSPGNVGGIAAGNLVSPLAEVSVERSIGAD